MPKRPKFVPSVKFEKVERRLLQCFRCGFTWHSRCQRPSVCPSCRITTWDRADLHRRRARGAA